MIGRPHAASLRHQMQSSSTCAGLLVPPLSAPSTGRTSPQSCNLRRKLVQGTLRSEAAPVRRWRIAVPELQVRRSTLFAVPPDASRRSLVR